MEHTSIINPDTTIMAEETLKELVMNLISWIESLHETKLKLVAQTESLHESNLKLEAQNESLTRDNVRLRNSNEELEARLTAYQSVTTTNSEINQQSASVMTSNIQQLQPETPVVVSAPSSMQSLNQQHQPHQHQHQQHGFNSMASDLQHQHQHQHILHQQQSQPQQHAQLIYQTMPHVTAQNFAPQQSPYMWTYDSSTSNGISDSGQSSYYNMNQNHMK